MKQNLGRAERKIRFIMGVMITAISIYTLTVNLWLGLIVLAVGGFTIYEGIAGWSLAGLLADAWIRPSNIYDEAEPEA